MNISAAIRRYQKNKMPQKRRLIAMDIAIALHGANKDPSDWWRQHALDRIAQYDGPDSLFKNYLMVGAWACCKACQAIDGQRHTVQSARASMALPQQCCTRDINSAGFAACSCDWEIDLDALKAARFKAL
jgi:hypothetical protein